MWARNLSFVVSILPLFYEKGNWSLKKGGKRENQPKSGNKILLASIAQLGERKTEDLEAPCSIHGRSNLSFTQFCWQSWWCTKRGLEATSWHEGNSSLVVNLSGALPVAVSTFLWMGGSMDSLSGGKLMVVAFEWFFHFWWGISSVGRARAQHARGLGFDSRILHRMHYF